MAVRLRSLLLAASLGIAAVVAATPAGAQDGTSTTAVAFGGGDPSAATTVASTDVPAATTAEAESTQEVTEGTTSESSLFTESRKVLATIGALVAVALALTLLTIRYWRTTKPVAPATHGEPKAWRDGAPVMGTEAALAAVPAGAAPPRPGRVASADHARADEDYEPHGTGEHARVEVGASAARRPGREARAAALGRRTDG
ncbi:MAG TPA: hypothetical protein P5254_12330 [Aquihabitans sp.]|mgnify:CR=1 FL=1|nr:hypothetical protein [Aquihabitans sp.]